MLKIVLNLLIVATMCAVGLSTAHAANFDGTRWNVGVTGTIDYDASKCQICRAENGRPSMSGCVNSATQMTDNVPYVIYCGGGVWGHAGTAPETSMVGPGESIGNFTAGSNDYWTVKVKK